MVKDNLEIEAKLLLDRTSFDHLLCLGRVVRIIEQVNIYYDDDWRLAKKGSTFRIRLSPNSIPTVTLKLALNASDISRTSREIEAEIGQAIATVGNAKFIPRQLNVESDVSPLFRKALLQTDVAHLWRLGSMRNRRHLVQFGDLGTAELDWVQLPTGANVFEVEIERDTAANLIELTKMIMHVVPDATPSRISKFERFRRALQNDPREVATSSNGSWASRQ